MLLSRKVGTIRLLSPTFLPAARGKTNLGEVLVEALPIDRSSTYVGESVQRTAGRTRLNASVQESRETT